MQPSPLRLSKRRSRSGKGSDVIVEGLGAVSRALGASSPPTSLEASLEELSAFLHVRAASLAVFECGGCSELAIHSWSHGSRTPALDTLVREASRRVRATEMPLVLESVWVELADQCAFASAWHDADLDMSLVGVPVKSDGVIVGSLAIVREHSAGDQADFAFDTDVMVLTTAANLVGLALRVARLAPSQGRDRAVELANGAAIGKAACWREIQRKVAFAAKTSVTVLLRGETGVGKTRIARAIHDASPRRGRPFVVLDCAALSETLLESELFGHEKGAFTGATSQRKGRFELADGGTLFLDEIGELSETFQAKLLRVLQAGEFDRVGGTATQKVDVRVIAATHRDLEAAVRAGTFRADLYYRLCVVPIRVPPLRERPDDIPHLAQAFIERFNAENQSDYALGETAIATLLAHPFPGNVRELENSVRRAASLSDRRTLLAGDFSFLAEALPIAEDAPLSSSPSGSAAPAARSFSTLTASPGRTGRLVERERVLEALQSTGWVMARAARLLGITPRQMGYAMQKHGIVVRKY